MKRIATVTFAAAALVGFAAQDAAAVHIALESRGQGTPGSPIEAVISGGTSPALVEVGDPLSLAGFITTDTGPGVTFVHQFDFGFSAVGQAGASATPNVLEVAGDFAAGFQTFMGTLTGPTLSSPLALTRESPPQTPRLQRIFADFDAIDTSGDANPTPYTLTISGQLLDNVTAGNYTGNVAVVPLPAAGLLFITALGSLVLLRRFRGGTRTAYA